MACRRPKACDKAGPLNRGLAGILGPVGCLLRLGTNAFLAAYSSESPSSKVIL